MLNAFKSSKCWYNTNICFGGNCLVAARLMLLCCGFNQYLVPSWCWCQPLIPVQCQPGLTSEPWSDDSALLVIMELMMDDLTSLRFRRLRKNKSHDDRVSERPLRAPCVKQSEVRTMMQIVMIQQGHDWLFNCQDQHIPRQSSLPVSPPVHHRLHQVSSLHHHHHQVAQVSAVRQVSGHHSPLVRRHETLNKEKTSVNAARKHAEEVRKKHHFLQISFMYIFLNVRGWNFFFKFLVFSFLLSSLCHLSQPPREARFISVALNSA